jgi:integrase
MMNDEYAIVLITEAPLVVAGRVADRVAAGTVFAEYRSRKAVNTLRAQDSDLALFAHYLEAAQLDAGDLLEPEAWRGISWGLVSGFVRWLVAEGLAVASINRALSTVKAYSKLAAQAGAVSPEALALIRAVAGYGHKEAKRLDEARKMPRSGYKKAEATSIPPALARALKCQPDTPQGARDALLMCLLLDHGLRVGEVARLEWSAIDQNSEYLTFYREKVDKTQTHRLSRDTGVALARYRQMVAFYTGPLLLASDKRGWLVEGSQMSTRAMNNRVAVLGQVAGVEGLSPHDCRHYWATMLSRKGTQIRALQDAGGWSSPAMPLRYAESARIANDGAEVD